MAKLDVTGMATEKPKAPLKTAGASVQVADVKARARKMRAVGTISQKQHDQLMAKADKISAAISE